MRVMPLSARHP